MTRQKKYSRKNFLKVSSLASAGVLLSSCTNSSSKKKNNGDQNGISQPSNNFSSTKDSAASATTTSSLKEKFLITKESAGYETLRQGFNKRVQKFPRAIALCSTLQDVTEAIAYAKQNRLPIAIRSGGHSFEGFSSNDDGMVINLSQMNKVELNEEHIATIQPGCTLSRLYDQLLPAKRIIPAGSCGGVGIGGLTLGGGYGFFSRKYGLTCDSLLSVEMVDANGTVHNSADDTELLWACRGGGNGSLGVITEMKFKTYPAPEFFTTYRFKALHLDAIRASQILETWFSISEQLPLSCFSAFVLNGKTLNILFTDFEDHSTEIKAKIELLNSLTDRNSVSRNPNLALSLKNFYGIQQPIYFKNASAGLYTGFEDVRNVIVDVLELVGNSSGLIYQVNTLGGNISNKEFEDASSFPHRSKNFLSELQAYYDHPSQEKALIATFEQVQQLLKSNGIQAQYSNYPDLEFKDWKTSYYGANYSRLQSIKRKYDPENFFRYEQSIQV